MFRYILAAALAALAPQARAETDTIRIGLQPGMSNLVLNVVNQEHLLEKRAKEAGIDLKVQWIVSSNGSVLNDGVLSGNIDIAGSGIPAFVTLWAKGKGTVNAKGIAAYGSLPGMLISRNPNVHSVKDFTSADRIALPAPKASIQAILLAMMAEKTWGPGEHGHLDSLMIGMSHPDAMIAMLSNQSEVNAHFTSSPCYDEELKNPAAHVVLSKEDIFPGALTHGMVFATSKFHDQNPKVMAAFHAALDDAVAIIHGDFHRATADYLALAREKIDPKEAEDIIAKLNKRFETNPRGVFAIASFMHRIGMTKVGPANWQEMFFENYWGDDAS